MARVIAHSCHALDHDRDPGQGPEIRVKGMSLGALVQGGLDPTQVRLIEPRLAPGPPRAPQRRDAALPPLPIPSADTLAADPEGPRNVCHDLSGGEQPRGPLASTVQPVEVSARSDTRMIAHVPIVAGKRGLVTILREIH